MKMVKLKVGILGATGMVGQRFVELLHNHSWFEVTSVAASPSSAGKTYKEAVKSRWKMQTEVPDSTGRLIVKRVEEDIDEICKEVDFVFSALDMDKQKIQEIEEAYASRGIPVVSNNSAHRWTEDVPMIIPEINPEHLGLIKAQQKGRGWKKGFIVVKPNCSIQSYMAPLFSLHKKCSIPNGSDRSACTASACQFKKHTLCRVCVFYRFAHSLRHFGWPALFIPCVFPLGRSYLRQPLRCSSPWRAFRDIVGYRRAPVYR